MSSQLFFKLPNGYRIPALGLGTSKAKEEDLEKALDAALEIGYRHIDTAFIYRNEHVIGRVLKRWLDSGKIKREDLFITSKLSFTANAPEYVEEYFLKSLENLQLDYIDLYLIHFPICALAKKDNETKWKTRETDHLAIWKKLEEQVDAGKIRSLGVSNFNKQQVERIIQSKPKHTVCNVQVELHVYLQQSDLVNFCLKNGITVTAYGPLGSPGYNDHLIRMGGKPKNIPDILNDSTIKRIAEKHGKSTAQIMLVFLLQNGIISIPKSITPSRLKENFDVFSFTLDKDDMKDLEALDIGEDARIFNFIEFPGLEENDEWPFPRK